MLRLDENFSLTSNVYPQIPQEVLWVPPRFQGDNASASTTSPGCLSPQDCDLKIVGIERGDIILVAYTGFYKDTKVTFINEFDMKSKVLKPLWKHKTQINCVACCVNEDRTLLGFITVKKVKKEDNTEVDVYESFISEVHDEGSCFSLTSEEPIRIQFLPSRDSNIILYIYSTAASKANRLRADLFSIYTQRHSNNTFKITAHPHLKHNISENLYWCEWDALRGLLYTIERKKNELKLTNNRVLSNNLICYNFPEKRPNVLFKYPIDIQFELSGNIIKEYMHVVRISSEDQNSNAVCLCQRHSYNPVTGSIPITVYILHHDVRLDFDIPIPMDRDPNTIRVHFDVVESSLLFVLVSGLYLHFIDCGVDREPRSCLVLHGEEFAEFISTIPPEQESKIPSDIALNVLYKINIDRAKTLLISELEDPEMHMHLLSLSTVNIKDISFVNQVISTLMYSHPLSVTTELMKEYLIGMTKLAYMRGKNVDNVLSRLESVLPLSVFDSLPQADGAKIINNMEIKHTALRTPRTKRNRMSLTSLDWKVAVEDYVPTQSVFRRFVSRVNQWFGLPENHVAQPEHAEEWYDQSKQIIVASYAKYLFEVLSKDLKPSKTDCYQWALDYRYAQGNTALELYKLIVNVCKDEDESTLFQLLSSLHCALEELIFPYPKAFYQHFMELGFKTLPRHVFLQFLDRNVFNLTPELVQKIFNDLKDTDEDKLYKYHLLSSLFEQDAISIMQQAQLDESYIVEHMLSFDSDKIVRIDMEDIQTADFLPLESYLKAAELKGQIPAEDLTFITSTSRKAFRRTLNLPETDTDE